MAKICNINFWIENDPLPLRNFSEVGFPYLANVNIFLIDISVQYGIYLFVILSLQGSNYYQTNVLLLVSDTSVQHGIYLFVILPLKGLQYS